MEKKLPIKFFHKRDNDKALNNLGVTSDSQGQKFRLEGQQLTDRANYFKGYFGNLRSKIKSKVLENNYLPTIVKLRLNEHAHAKTHRTEIAKIFNKGKKVNIIGMIGDDELLLKVDTETDLSDIEAKLNDTDKHVIGISAVEDAAEFSPIIEIDDSEERDLKVKLINYGDYNLNEVAERSFENLCKSRGFTYTKLNYTKDLILYRVQSVKPQELTNFNESESIFSITKVPTLSLTKSSVFEEGDVKIKVPEVGVDYFSIGVFDEGISDIPHLVDWKSGSYVSFSVDEYDRSHGTFVAGIINYGDALEGKTWTGTKPFKITEAVIFPNGKYGYIDEPIMVEFMREAVKQHPNVRVWNFSIGNDVTINDSQYSDFAKYLDELQSEYNILIVKAAGNCTNFLKAAPRGRITEASESVKTLVVGSIAQSKRDHDISAFNYPSPFSMVGPGVADVIKPDLVHYGGNVGILNGQPDINGVRSFSSSGKISAAVGTSYSAPRVAALAAELAGSLKEEFNSDLIKALLIHSAKHPEEFDANLMDRIGQIGFGMPSKVGDILFNDPNEVTLILMDSVDKGSNIKIMDFPFPKSLVEDGHYYGQVKITLVSSPEINPYHGVEYIQSNVDAAFGTYARKVEVGDSKIKRNLIDMEDRQNLLLPSKYSTRKQKAATAGFKSERFLRSYSQGHTELFLPIKKWCFDLSELQEAPRRTSLGSDRLWFLQLEAAYRNNFELRMKDSKNISQEFVMIISIRDSKNQGKVYDDVSTLLSQYNFLHENVKIDERVTIS
jgi:hypothetical protein